MCHLLTYQFSICFQFFPLTFLPSSDPFHARRLLRPRRPRLVTNPQRASSTGAPYLPLAAALSLKSCIPTPQSVLTRGRIGLLGGLPRCSSPPSSLFSSLQLRILVAGTPHHFPEFKRHGRAHTLVSCSYSRSSVSPPSLSHLFPSATNRRVQPPFSRSSPATSIHQVRPPPSAPLPAVRSRAPRTLM